MRNFSIAGVIAAGLWLCSASALALDAATVSKLGFGDGDEKIAAIAALVAGGDPRRRGTAAGGKRWRAADLGKRVLIVKGEEATDAVTGAKVSPLPADLEDVVFNNVLRREIGGALAALRLMSPDRAIRLAAAKELTGNADEAMLPLIKKALARETVAEVKAAARAHPRRLSD
jgi:urea transport system permease protein